MVLKNFTRCHPDHKDKYEYCCIRQKKIFCELCFNKQHYPCHLGSSHCGNIEKLSHKGITYVEQMRERLYIKQLTSNYDRYKEFDKRIVTMVVAGTERMKDYVQQKLPVFLYKMINLLLENLHTDIYKKKRLNSNENFSKLDSMSFEFAQFLNQAKNDAESDKDKLLAKCITGILNVQHQLQGLQFKFKRQFEKTSPEESQRPLNKILEEIEKIQYPQMFTKLKINWKKNMEIAMGDITKAIKNLQFPQIKFMAENSSYTISEKYPIQNIRTSIFSNYHQYSNEIYKGYHLNIQWLEKCPQELLQVSKSFIKEKLESLHSKTNQPKKAKYPYKFAYPVSTTLQNDEQYEKIVLDLQKDYIKSFIKDGSSPYHNSTKIGIMGKEFILINFYKKKHPQKKNEAILAYEMKIFNYDAKRKNYYENVKEILQLNTLTKNKEDQTIILDEQLSQIQLAYMNFQLGFKCLLNDETQINEQGSTIANRGSEMFKRVAEIWKSAAQVHLEISRNIQELKMIVL